MSRLIAIRRFRSDRRQDDPTLPADVSRNQLTASLTGLPHITDLAEVVLNRSERTFGRRTDGSLHERYALEAVIDALSSPSPALDDTQPNIPPRGHRAHTESNAA